MQHFKLPLAKADFPKILNVSSKAKQYTLTGLYLWTAIFCPFALRLQILAKMDISSASVVSHPPPQDLDSLESHVMFQNTLANMILNPV